MSQNQCYSTYLQSVFEPHYFKRVVQDIIKILNPLKNSFDVIAFKGMSGSLVAPTVAMKLDKRLVMVRKKTDRSHSGMDTEGYKMANRVVFLDDCISSGETICSLFSDLVKSRRVLDDQYPLPKIVAVVLYNDSKTYDEGVTDHLLNNSVRDHFKGVPVYAFEYSKENMVNGGVKTKLYCNELTRKILGYSPFTNTANYYYVDIK